MAPAPAFSELILRAEVDPTDADVQRQLDALTAFSRALSLFVDGRPGASMRTYLDVVERADFASDPWLPPAMTRNDAVAVLSVNAAKGQEFDLVIVAGCLEGALPRRPARRGCSKPGGSTATRPVARADAVLDAERRRFTLAASRARDRVVFTASRVDGRGEPSRFLRELGLELPAEPALDTKPARVPGGRRGAAPGRRRPGPAGRRTAGRRDHPGRHPGRRPGHLVVATATTPSTPSRSPPRAACAPPTPGSGPTRTATKYFFGSVAGLDDRSSYQMAFGRLMHTIFELAAKGDVANEPDDLKAAYRGGSTPPGSRPGPSPTSTGATAWACLSCGTAARPRPPAAPCGSRSGSRWRSDHLVRGRIDRVDPGPDGGIVLLDYKTARYPASEEEAERSLQLAIYYLAALRRPELAALGRPVEMQLVYPARVMNGRFTRVSQHPGPDHASKVERRLLALLDGAAAESFDPDPHADCRMCAFKPICPMWPQGEEFLAPAHPPAGLSPTGTPSAGPAARNGGEA